MTRRRSWKRILFPLVAGILLLAALLPSSHKPMLSPGQLAPDFTLPDQNGDSMTLSSFRGKNAVVLIFYPGDQTPVCTKQLCEVRDSFSEFQAAGAIVFGVNPWGESSHRSFAERHQFPFSLLVDRGNQVAHAYHAALGWGAFSFANRTVYVIGKDGKILFARRGKPSPDEVLAALR